LRRTSRVEIPAAILVALLATAGAPPRPRRSLRMRSPLRRPHLRAGDRASGRGSVTRESASFRKLSQDFPDSPFAPQALLKTAELIYPVGTWDQIGSASPAAIKEASDLLTALSQKYRSSREAPRALVKLGFLALEPAKRRVDGSAVPRAERELASPDRRGATAPRRSCTAPPAVQGSGGSRHEAREEVGR